MAPHRPPATPPAGRKRPSADDGSSSGRGRAPIRNPAVWAAAAALMLTLGLATGNDPDRAQVQTVPLSEALTIVADGRVARAETSDRALTVRLEPVDRTDPVWQATYSATYSETLIGVLLDAGIEVSTGSSPRPGPLATIASSMLPLLLILGLLLLFLRRGATGLGRLGRGRGTPIAPPETRFGDVAGCDEAIDELRDVVDLLRHPGRYRASGAALPRGVLLVGPPGTGKTLLARAVAGEAGVPFFAVSGSEFVEVFVGQGASRVRDLFAKARKHPAAIVFIDEIDAVGRARGGSSQTGANVESENTLNQLLTEMDGFSRSNIIVLAATNRADMLDRALTRAGRFDRSVQVAPPDRAGRRALLDLHTAGLALGDDVDLDELARRTVGMTGADIANLTNRAVLDAVKEAAHGAEPDAGPGVGPGAGPGAPETRTPSEAGPADSGEATVVRARHLDDALATLMLGRARTSAVLTPRDRLVTAWHEAGHALAALLLADAHDPVAVSIIPRGPAGGVTWLAGSDHQLATRDELLARLCVAVAGRAAETIGLDGHYTAGAHNDLKVATDLAEAMVTQWGMGRNGLMVRDPEKLLLARGTVDQEISSMLDDALARAEQLLKAHRPLADATVAALLDRENLTRADLVALADELQVTLPDKTLLHPDPA